MTVKSVPADVFDSSDLENPGWYNWRVAAPGSVVEKDEYKGGETTGRNYTAISAFLVAQEIGQYDENGLLTGAEKPMGVSINCNFKITKPDGSWDKKGMAKLKSLFVINTGSTPKTTENEETGKQEYDFEAISRDIADFTGWCPIVHGSDSEDESKKFQYLQGNFRKSAPEKVKV